MADDTLIAKKLVGDINAWIGEPDQNEARDKQRAILLLDRARDALTAQQQEIVRLRKVHEEGAIDLATLKFYGHTALTNLEVKLLIQRAETAEAQLAAQQQEIAQLTEALESIRATIAQQRCYDIYRHEAIDRISDVADRAVGRA